MTELRELIAQRLIGQVNPPQHPWRDRVVETAAMDPNIGLPPFGDLPFIVIRQTGTTVDQNRVATLAYEVWIHANNTSFSELDALERLAVSLLDSVILVDDEDNSRTWAMGYGGTLLGDVVIPAWDAYARGLRFTTSGAGTGGAIGGADDERAQFLRANAAYLFCPPTPCVQTDPTDWAPTDDCPGIYVVPLEGPVEVERYASQTIFRETLVFHVFAPTLRAQQAWVDRLALELPGQLNYLQRNKQDSNGNVPRVSSLLLRVTALNPAATSSEGQLRVEANFSELACDAIETAGPLRYIDITPRPAPDAIEPPGSGPDILLPLDPVFVIGRRPQ